MNARSASPAKIARNASGDATVQLDQIGYCGDNAGLHPGLPMWVDPDVFAEMVVERQSGILVQRQHRTLATQRRRALKRSLAALNLFPEGTNKIPDVHRSRRALQRFTQMRRLATRKLSLPETSSFLPCFGMKRGFFPYHFSISPEIRPGQAAR
ncbi:hypothetical protein ACTGJ9_034865 [Bradyrhizobium sp. RDM12]